MKHKTTRIDDVAREAGVSTATVSRALSKPDLLTEATRKAVFDAIRKTGYRVNRTARNLRTQKAGAVLVLVPDLGNPFFSKILSGISEGFTGTEYSILIADTRNLANREDTIVDSFLDGRIDGMISLDGAFTLDQLANFSDNCIDHQIVFACEWVDGAEYPSVRSDNAKGARMALRHLYDLGHRSIAHVTGPEGNVLTHVRREGMMDERHKLNLSTPPEWIIRGDFSIESGRCAAQKILGMDQRPTAVFCASDQVAFGLISTLCAAGVRVPEDISVVGFDDIELSQNYVPALTTVRQNRPELGQRAARYLLQRIDGGVTHPQDGPDLVDVELVVRNSTARISS